MASNGDAMDQLGVAAAAIRAGSEQAGMTIPALEVAESPTSTPNSGTSSLAPKMTSMRVFREFMKQFPDPADSTKTVIDASGIVSKACYEMWCTTRNLPLTDDYRAAKTFQRALTGHLSATDGRLPFSPEEEVAVLQIVRVKRVWPCFAGTSHVIGAKGFRSKGFHERQLSGDVNPFSLATQDDVDALGLTPQVAAKSRGKKRKLAGAASDPSHARYAIPSSPQSASSLAATTAMLMSLSRPYQFVPPPVNFGAYPMWMAAGNGKGMNPTLGAPSGTTMPSGLVKSSVNGQFPTALDQTFFPYSFLQGNAGGFPSMPPNSGPSPVFNLGAFNLPAQLPPMKDNAKA